MRRILAGTALALLFAAGAAAAETPQSCPAPLEDADCWWNQTGDVPAEEIAKSGDELIRFYYNTYGMRGPFDRLSAVFDVRRSPRGEVTLKARQLDIDHGEFVLALPRSIWSHLVQRWRRFNRDRDEDEALRARLRAEPPVASTRGGPAGGNPGTTDVETLLQNLPDTCSHSDGIDFDTVIGGKIGRRRAGGCGGDMAEKTFAELSDYLLSQAPYCARLRKDQRHACFLLRGDRDTAARAVSAIADADADNVNCADRDSALHSLAFAPDIALTVEGETGAAAEAAQRYLDWRCRLNGPLTTYDRIEGEPDGGVVVTGVIASIRDPANGGYPDIASFRQTWRRGGKSFRIVSWDIERPVERAASPEAVR